MLSRLVVVLIASMLAACSNTPAPPPVDTAAQQKAALEARANKQLALYDQMRASGSLDIAASLGEEIVTKFPNTAAAAQVQQTLPDIRAKAAAKADAQRLSRLWVYNAVSEMGGTQYTAWIADNNLGIPNARVRLVLREHPKWGESTYLLLDNAKFDCGNGCPTLPVAFDDAPAQRMKATVPTTGEPALFIDDNKAFIAKLEKAKKVSITATLKGAGEKTFVFEVGGYDATKLPRKH